MLSCDNILKCLANAIYSKNGTYFKLNVFLFAYLVYNKIVNDISYTFVIILTKIGVDKYESNYCWLYTRRDIFSTTDFNRTSRL